MISIDDLKKERESLNAQLQETLATTHQLRGAIQVLTNLIARDETESDDVR